ncbi:MAG TPA: Dyp-type peroxidase [Solirubrobacterales bacterium]|nr:Dyp-type peroxidase [Solirubrobacterales bacterium]
MSEIDRRSFLKRAGGVGLGGLATGYGLGAATSEASAAGESPEQRAERVNETELSTERGFDGVHQAGILTPAANFSIFLALDSIAAGEPELVTALKNLSSRARELTRGGEYPLREYDDPPYDSGTLGSVIAPDALTVTIAFGAKLFDGRYGLAARKPARLTEMRAFPHDELDPTRTGGDVLVQLAAGHQDTVEHALRELVRPVRGALQPRWTVAGFTGAQRGPSPHSSRRNHFGFRDGTSNPDVTDPKVMDRLVWVQPGGGEPAWTAGGTYQVVRTIRMHVEFWDRVGLHEQEEMIGRKRDTGAPLGGKGEYENPRYDLDPKGERIPLEAHIRLANPREPATIDQRILRRAWNYSEGFDEDGQLDVGLLFVAFNQDIQRQFVAIQERLNEEPMVDYVTPEGGGYFFAPPASRDETDWVGSGLFA